jgi:hypothetical protein
MAEPQLLTCYHMPIREQHRENRVICLLTRFAVAAGVIIAEGLESDVTAYTSRLRALPWAAMQV